MVKIFNKPLLITAFLFLIVTTATAFDFFDFFKPAIAPNDILLLESGDYFLLESGETFFLE